MSPRHDPRHAKPGHTRLRAWLQFQYDREQAMSEKLERDDTLGQSAANPDIQRRQARNAADVLYANKTEWVSGQRPVAAEHFTLRFIEEAGDKPDPILVKVELGGDYVGTLVLYDREWDAIWRSLVDATAKFDQRGIALARRGRTIR